MKNIFLFLLFICLLFSCKSKRSFQYKLADFKEYESSLEETNESHLLPKCWNGWFELRIKKSKELRDGIEIRDFKLDPNSTSLEVNDSTSLDFFCYIAFIDDHRLVFYTPLKTKKKNVNNVFNLFATKNKNFKRGYYTYKHSPTPGSPGVLKMSIENQRQTPITELTFEVHFNKIASDQYEIASLNLIKIIDKDDTHLEQDSPDGKREYTVEELFSFQPTYYFEKRQKVKLFANSKKGKNSIEIDSIYLDRTSFERQYYFNNELQFLEIINKEKVELDSIKTW